MQIVLLRSSLARRASHVSKGVRDRHAGPRALFRAVMLCPLGALTHDRERQLGLARVSSLRILRM